MKPISYFMFLVVLVLYNSGCTTEKRLLVMASKPETKIISTKKTYALDKKLALSKSKNIQILSSKGEKEYRIKNYKSAEIFFAKVLRIDFDNLHALTGMAWTLYDSKQFDKALVFFKKANKKYPTDGSAKRGLAYLFYRNGKLQKARELLGKLDRNKWPELTQIDLEKKTFSKQKKGNLQKIDSGKKGIKKYQGLGNSYNDLFKSQKPNHLNMIFISEGDLYLSKKRRNRKKKIKVKSFFMDKFEVTNSQYAAFVKISGYPEPPFWDSEQFSGAHLPVVGVSWLEAKAFCFWAKKRLPTEAEWSYVAKGGLRDRVYPWGMKLKQRNAIFGLDLISGGPKAVGRRPQGSSIHAVEDLAGNVWEWVQEKYKKTNKKAFSINKSKLNMRVLKGGSWANGSWALKNFNRTGDFEDRKLPVYGFRCVKSNTN